MQRESDKPKVSNQSDRYAQIAFQGPKANDYFRELLGQAVDEITFSVFEPIFLSPVSPVL